MIDDRKIALHACGPGGYRCPCCGPSPRQRRRFARMVKRRARQAWKRAVTRIHREHE